MTVMAYYRSLRAGIFRAGAAAKLKQFFSDAIASVISIFRTAIINCHYDHLHELR